MQISRSATAAAVSRFFLLSFFFIRDMEREQKAIFGRIGMINYASRTATTTAEEMAMTMRRRMVDSISGRSGGNSRRRQQSRTILTYALFLILCTELTVSHCCYVFPKGIPGINKQSSLSSPILIIDNRIYVVIIEMLRGNLRGLDYIT